MAGKGFAYHEPVSGPPPGLLLAGKWGIILNEVRVFLTSHPPKRIVEELTQGLALASLKIHDPLVLNLGDEGPNYVSHLRRIARLRRRLKLQDIVVNTFLSWTTDIHGC